MCFGKLLNVSAQTKRDEVEAEHSRVRLSQDATEIRLHRNLSYASHLSCFPFDNADESLKSSMEMFTYSAIAVKFFLATQKFCRC